MIKRVHANFYVSEIFLACLIDRYIVERDINRKTDCIYI